MTATRRPDALAPPSEGIVRDVDARLRDTYGLSRLGNKDDPLDELIFIILSGKTSEAAYMSAFDALRGSYGSWQDVAKVDIMDIESVIRPAGLANKKAGAIKGLLVAIEECVGCIDLSSLRDMDDASAYGFLRGLPGVGPKTARCVLAYSLGRPAFAVDAHVSRIVRRLGWSCHHRLTERVQDVLQDSVPVDIRLSLHVNLVVHGRSTCTERQPHCTACVLADLCPSAFRID